MKIALLLPTRERIENKKRLLKSIKDTATNTDNVVLYMGIDDDDPTKEDVIKLCGDYSWVKIVEIHNEGKFLGLGKLFNLCAKEAKEEILSLIGDDMVFQTKDWDSKIIEEFNEENCPKDKFKMVYVYDGWHGNRLAVNAFLHRSYYDINGYFAREEFMANCLDKWLQRIFFVFGRLKYKSDIYLEHKHWLFRKSDKDNVSDNLLKYHSPIQDETIWTSLKEQRLEEAQRISQKLGLEFDKTKLEDQKK